MKLYIYRVATVEVQEVLSGAVRARSMPVMIYGGLADGVSMVFADEAELAAGDRVVLFLFRPGNPAVLHVPGGVWHPLLVYQLDGETARTEFQAPLPVSELAQRVRAAAAVKPAAP